MRKHTGVATLSVLALVYLPWLATANCPRRVASDATCNAESSGIESCVNAIWRNFDQIESLTTSLATMPSNPVDRLALVREAKAGVLPAIRALGQASADGRNNFYQSCDPSTHGIQSCEGGLLDARRGLELLTKPEVVAALPVATRERLKKTLRQHAAQYTDQLDLVAASGQGDPSQLCNETYASVAGCARAVAADRAAIRDQVFPVISCGRVLPGQFLTAKDAAAEARRDADPPGIHVSHIMAFTFEDAQGFYQDRLQRETELLEKTRRER